MGNSYSVSPLLMWLHTELHTWSREPWSMKFDVTHGLAHTYTHTHTKENIFLEACDKRQCFVVRAKILSLLFLPHPSNPHPLAQIYFQYLFQSGKTVPDTPTSSILSGLTGFKRQKACLSFEAALNQANLQTYNLLHAEPNSCLLFSGFPEPADFSVQILPL